MSHADDVIERAAARLQSFVDSARSEGGLKARLAEELADDPDFLRKLKPSLIAARARGQAPTNETPPARPQAPPRPALPRPRKRGGGGGNGGPNPFVVVGAALAAGIVLAKVIDWRSHAHPRL
jgi:hypothetical protein